MLGSELILWYILVSLIIFIAIGLFMIYPKLGLYLMAFFYPYYYLEIIYRDLNVPYVDAIALLLFIAWGLSYLGNIFLKHKKPSLKDFPGWHVMALFAISGFLSITNVEYEFVGYSVKYVLRPLIFFYLMYVILPYNLITDRATLLKILKIIFWVGIIVSTMGLWSLIFPPIEGMRRAIPIGIFGIYPLGWNHNLLSEVLVFTIPVAFLLYYLEKNLVKKNWYLIALFFMSAINLLTLSRAGWIAFAAEIIILLIYKYNYFKDLIRSYGFYFILAGLIPVFYLMYKLLISSVSIGATLNRLKLIDIGITMFQQYPLLGAGAGMFTKIADQMQWFIIEYGSAIDSHSIIFKVLAEQGIVGMITFSALIFYIFYRIYKGFKAAERFDNTWNWVILLLAIGAIGCFTFQIFGTSYYLAKMWLPIGLALASTNLLVVKPRKL